MAEAEDITEKIRALRDLAIEKRRQAHGLRQKAILEQMADISARLDEIQIEAGERIVKLTSAVAANEIPLEALPESERTLLERTKGFTIPTPREIARGVIGEFEEIKEEVNAGRLADEIVTPTEKAEMDQELEETVKALGTKTEIRNPVAKAQPGMMTVQARRKIEAGLEEARRVLEKGIATAAEKNSIVAKLLPAAQAVGKIIQAPKQIVTVIGKKIAEKAKSAVQKMAKKVKKRR